MSVWTRAHGRLRCGGCGALLAAGDPVLVIPVGRRTLLRCGACRQAPMDLPAPVAPARLTLGAWTSVGAVAHDFKQRAMGERDPGEEG